MQVVSCVGPSGTNIEYVLRLVHAVKGARIFDPHLMALEKCVLELCKQRDISDKCFDELGIVL